MKKRVSVSLSIILCLSFLLNVLSIPVKAVQANELQTGYLVFHTITDEELFRTGYSTYNCRVIVKDDIIFANIKDIAVLTNCKINKISDSDKTIQLDRHGYYLTADLTTDTVTLSTDYFEILKDIPLQGLPSSPRNEVYLPLEKTLYLLNSTWFAGDDGVYISTPKDTLWSVASEYYDTAKERPDKWIVLGTDFGDYFSNSFKYGILSILDEIDYRLFISFIDELPFGEEGNDILSLKSEHILNALMNIETVTLPNDSEKILENQISDFISESTPLFSYMEDILDSPNDVSEIMEKVIDDPDFIKWKNIKSEAIPLLSKTTEQMGNLAVIAKAVEINVTAFQIGSYTDLQRQQLLLFSQSDTSRYKNQKTVKKITSMADTLYDRSLIPVIQGAVEIAEFLFQEGFEQTSLGKYVHIYDMFITGLSMDPAFRDALKAGDDVRSLSWYIDIGDMATNQFADVLSQVIPNEISQKDFGYTQEANKKADLEYLATHPLSRIRNAYYFMLSCYLQSWNTILELSETEKMYLDDVQTKAKEERTNIASLMIRLMHSEQYDSCLYLQKNFGNLYSDGTAKHDNLTEPIREKIPVSLILYHTDPLKADQVKWIVEPTWDYDVVEPIPGNSFSDILSTGIGSDTTSYADGKEPLYPEQEHFQQCEMSFPLYSNLPEYYNVKNKNGGWSIFHVPSRTDFLKSNPQLNFPDLDEKGYRYDDTGISFYTDPYVHQGDLYSPWNVIHLVGRGGRWGNIYWDTNTEKAYFSINIDPKPIEDLDLHKPYPGKKVIIRACSEENIDSIKAFVQGNNYVETIEQSPLYAYIAPDGTRITDFVYEYAGDFSDGIAACSKDGKTWGYIDDMGNPITDFIYEPAWDTPDGRAFPCTDSTIVAVKDGQYGLLYRDGSTLIDFGEFEALAPSWNNQLWAKKDGLWGLLDLAEAKEQAGFPML